MRSPCTAASRGGRADHPGIGASPVRTPADGEGISAGAEDEKLRIIVEDDGGNAASGAAKGNRMGLANVAERLVAHFGADATLSAGPKEEAGFRNMILVPLRKASSSNDHPIRP